MGHQSVRVVGDAGCERIHKEKKRQSKVLLTFQEGDRARCGEIHQPPTHFFLPAVLPCILGP